VRRVQTTPGIAIVSRECTDRRIAVTPCIVLADVPLEQILDSKYVGQGTVLHLGDGRRVKLRGINLDEFARLTSAISALIELSGGADTRADDPPCAAPVVAKCEEIGGGGRCGGDTCGGEKVVTAVELARDLKSNCRRRTIESAWRTDAGHGA
jgi:hypothetical protein